MRCFSLLFAALLAIGCSTNPSPPRDGAAGDLPDYTVSIDWGLRCADPTADRDGDGLSNAEEGCLEGRDSDDDGAPDWQDFDSDGDGIGDHIEIGVKGSCLGPAQDRWPCDSDGDGLPDYLDLDSDSDGILDKDEDPNSDGLVGCCLRRCNELEGGQRPDGFGPPYHARSGARGCVLTGEGCGSGQTCVAGLCTPPTTFLCSKGETDRRLQDSFGDGKLDGERGTFICRDATEAFPHGRKYVQKRKTTDPSYDATSGDWQVALELDAKYVELSLPGTAERVAAATSDQRDPGQLVAGFIVSLPDTQADIEKELAVLLATISAQPPGGAGTVSVRASGTRGKSHDKYDTLRGTLLDVSLQNATDPATARNQLIATLLGRPSAELGKLPSPYVGAAGQTLVIRLHTLRRFAFQRNASNELAFDAAGYPKEDLSKPEQRRIIVMGAVALRAHYEDVTRKTGILVDDLSDGTAVSIYSDSTADECDVGLASLGNSLSLQYIPIAASVGVTVDGVEISRGRQTGFDYLPAENAIVLRGVSFLTGSHVVISYQRWVPRVWL